MSPAESTDDGHCTLVRVAAAPSSLLYLWTGKLAGILERLSDGLPPFVVVIAIAILFILAVLCSRGGYAHPELQQYIPHYLSHRPVLEKIFDFQKVEIWLSYRPRPLSYLVDNLDVAFIAWSCRRGFPHLLSASYYLFWIGDCLLLGFYFRSHLRIDRLSAGLLICLLSTDPVMFFNGYFRSAKPGGTFFLLSAFVVFAECFRVIMRNGSKLRCAVLACFGAGLLFCACLFDEIPVAFAIAATVMLTMEWVIDRKSQLAKASAVVLIAIISVLITFAYYDFVLHPKLIWAITGERPSMAYQTGTAAALLSHPALWLLGSASVFCDAFSYLVGNISAFMSFMLLVALVSIVWDSSQGHAYLAREPKLFSFLQRHRPITRILSGGVLMIVCLYGMISRHPPIARLDVRRSWYVLPLTMVFLLFVGMTVAIIVARGYLSRGKLQLALLALVASNLVFVLTMRAFGPSDPFTKVLLVSLRNPSAFDSEAREDPGLARLQRAVFESPVYKSLRRAMTDPH